MNLLTIKGLTKAYTDKILFAGADFSINEGDKIGMIGINGTGKSTLLKIIAGLEEAERGEITRGNSVHCRYLPQDPVFEPGTTIYDYVITKNITHQNEWSIEGDAKSVLNRLGFTKYDLKTDLLSGGQKKKVALAAALMADCEILILDEPTNHLDSDMTQWLEEYLQRRGGALVMVTHDRYFLDRVSNRIVEIDKGSIYSYNTNYSGFLEAKAQREETIQAAERKRKSLYRIDLEWIQRGARARSTKQKAHIRRFEELRDAQTPVTDAVVEMSSVSQRMGKTTIELQDICKAYGENRLIQDFTYIFLPQDRIGFIGNNGCGKSTLMKIINQKIQPDQGELTIGSTIKLGYFSQENEYMDEKLRVIDYIRETAEYIQTVDGPVTASKMLERFLFDATLQYQVIGRLSGGEKRRLYLLKILMESPNVLVLDEPTNDLDIQTLTILENYLDGFDGIVITVSHDRYFLDRIVKRIFAFEGNGVIKQYEGGYTDYLDTREQLEQRGAEQGLTNGVKKTDSKMTEMSRMHERKLKFTYQEQKDLETIDDEIAALEEQLTQCEENMTHAVTDFMKLNELTSQKETLEQKLEEKMERWMYLNDLVERIREQNQ